MSGQPSSEQLDRLCDRLDTLTRYTSNSTPPGDTTSGEKLTFTLSQIASGFFAILAVVGALLGAWNNINGQVMSQKVSTDLIIEQIKKDIIELKDAIKMIQTKNDTDTTRNQEIIAGLSHRIDELDSSVSQMYNRTRPKDR